jgi:hypothetical protein
MSDIRRFRREEQQAQNERNAAIMKKGRELFIKHMRQPLNVQVNERFAYLERKLDAIHAVLVGKKDVNYPEGNFRKEMTRQAATQPRYY